MNINPLSVFVGITIASFVLCAVSAIIYLTKKNVKDASNKLFRLLIVAVLVEFLSEMSCHMAVQSDHQLVFWDDVIFKSYLIFILVFSLILNLYIISIDQTVTSRVRNKRLKTISIGSAFFILVACILNYFWPIYEYYDGIFGYTHGPLIEYIVIPSTGILVASWIHMAVKNLRRGVEDIKRFLPVLLFAFFSTMLIVLQGLINKGMLLITITHAATVLAIMFTIENPDIKIARAAEKTNGKLKKLDESKDEFMSIASHQLRTPLTAVSGYSSMLADGDLGKLTQQQQDAVEKIVESAMKMSGTVSDFLNVSRLQTGKFVISKAPVNLKKILQSEINQTLSLANDRNVKLKVDLSKNIPIIDADEDKISQVMMNFIDNAIYYSNNNPVEVKLYAKNNKVEFRVIDHGIGIPASEQHKLFGKFYRASNAKIARPDGTGVGLFLARKVIVGHGGTIVFKSKVNEGSTFGFTLPVKKNNDTK